MKLLPILLALSLAIAHAVADDQETRAVFSPPPSRDVAATLKKAATDNKRVLVIVTDPKKKQAFHVKATMGSGETQKLLKDNFLVVVTDFKDKRLAGMIHDVNPEHPAYVLLKPDGSVVASGDAAMGAANGFNLVKGWVDAK